MLSVVDLAPRHRPATPGMRAPAISSRHRAAEPVRDGARDPADVERLALAVQHDRHHRRVATQHPQRLRRDRTTEVQARRAGPVLQVLQPDHHVHVRAVPAALRHVAVVEHVAAHLGQRFGLPFARAAVVVGGQRLCVGVDHRGDRVEHSGIVEPALDLPAALGQPGQLQLVDQGRWPVVRLLAVLVEQFDQRRAPLLQLARGVQLGLGGQLLLDTRPLLAATTARPTCRPAPGRSPRHVATPRAPREHLRRRGQPRRQHAPVQPGPRRHLLGRDHPAGGPRVPPSPAGHSAPAPATCSPARRTHPRGPARRRPPP